MATMSELDSDERARRIAELKRKMQDSARQHQPVAAEAEPQAAEAVSQTSVEGADAVNAPVAAPIMAASTLATAEASVQAAVTEADDAVEEAAETEVVAPVVQPTPMSGNGASAAAMVTMPSLDRVEVTDPEQLMRSEMNRREFMTYAWGAALGLLVLQTGVVSFVFMYPRFKAGEFGGKFFIGPESNLPTQEQAPVGNSTGKFWLVTTEANESRALYMVCTHLGCLYKWEPSTWRFECPCHGSKFSHDGYYIEGPAPRSLDSFPMEVDATGTVVVDTGEKIPGNASAESPARAQVG